MLSLRPLVLLAALPTLSFAQTVHLVPHQAALQPFIDQAAPGDVLIFEAPFKWISPINLTKGLTFVNVQLLSGPSSFVIHDLPADQAVVFRDCHFGFNTDDELGDAVVRIEDCAGPVFFERCLLSEYTDVESQLEVLRIERSDAVHLSDTTVQGCRAPFSTLGSFPAVVVLDSDLWLHASELVGGSGWGEVGTGGSSAPFAQTVGGSTALLAEDSRVVAVGSSFRGGDGEPTNVVLEPAPGGFSTFCFGPFPGLPGVTATGDTELILYNSTSVAGDYGTELCSPDSSALPPLPDVLLEGTSALVSEDSGFGLAFEPGTLSPGTSALITVEGEPGELVLLAFSTGVHAPLEAGFGPFGSWLTMPVQAVVSLGVLDAGGSTSLALASQQNPASVPIGIYAQAFGVLGGASGELELRSFPVATATLMP